MAAIVPVGIRLVATGLDIFERAGLTVARTVAEITEGIREIPRGTAQAGQSVDDLTDKLAKLELQLNGLRSTQINALFNNFKVPAQVTQQITQTTQGIAFLKSQIAATAAGGVGGGGIGAGIGAALSSAGSGFGGFVSNAAQLAEIPAKIIAVTTAITGAAEAAGILGAVHIGANIDRDFTFIRAVLQATDGDMNKLKTTAEEVGRSLPTSFGNVVGQIRELGRAGISIDEISGGVAKLAASLSILAKGEASPEKIAESLAAGSKAFGPQGDSINDVAKSILGIANATRLSIPEVLSGFNKLAPIAQILHLTSAEVGAFIGVIGAAGVRGEEAGTGIRNFFLRLQNPSREGAEAIKKFAPTLTLFDDLGNTKKPIEVIQQLGDAFGDAAISEGKLTEQQRAFALSQIFQTRAASVAALAIINGTEAYNEYLAAIEQTDPLQQAAQATDNFADKLLLIRNKGVIGVNALVSGVLPGLKDFADQVDRQLGEALTPGSGARTGIDLLGKAINSIASGQGIGELGSAIETAIGPSALARFNALGEAVVGIKRAVDDQLLPSIKDLLGNLGQLALDTVFSPDAITLMGRAIITAVGFTAALAQGFSDIARAIDQNIDSIARFGRAVVVAIGNAASLLGEFLSALGKLGHIDVPQEELFPGMKADIAALNSLGNAAAGVGNVLSNVGTSADTIVAGIDAFAEREKKIKQTADDITRLQTTLGQFQQIQLSPDQNAPDVTQQIDATQQLIAARQADLASLRGQNAAAGEGVSLQDRLSAATAAFNASMGLQVDKFDDLAGAEREHQNQLKAIESNTKSLQQSYETLTREVDKSVRETQDRIVDLNTRTQESLDKLAEQLATRIQDIRDNLKQANEDARDSLDFSRIIREQRTELSRETEALSTIISRSFDDQRTGIKDLQTDRDTLRQRDLQAEQLVARQKVDAELTAASRVTEDLSNQLQLRNQDRQRALQLQQQDETNALQRTFDKANTERSRAQEDIKRQTDLTRQLAAAKTPQDRSNIVTQFNQSNIDIAAARQVDDENTKIRRDQEKQLEQLSRRQAQQQLTLSRQIAKEELAFRRQLQDQDLLNRIEIEKKFLVVRFALEDAFLAHSRELRIGDTATERQLADQEISQKQQLADTQQKKDDAIQETQFEHDQQRREDAANRETGRAVRDAETRAREILKQYGIDFDKLTRDRQQQLTDILDRANQLTKDVVTRVGTNFPGATQFGANANAAVGNANLQNQLNLSAGQGAFTVPSSLQGNQQAPPELVAAALIPVALLGGNLEQLNQSVINLTEFMKANPSKFQTGVTVEIDDFVNNGTFVGDGSVENFFRQSADPLAKLIQPRAGV